MADSTKTPRLSIERAAVPTSSKVSTSLSRALDRRRSGTPSLATLGAGGAAVSAAPLALCAETSGSPTSTDVQSWTMVFRRVRLQGPSLIHADLFGAVVVLARRTELH
eukprot:722491-Alexandrium_andersonii.AAC.1